MHKSDREISYMIEMAFISNGYKPHNGAMSTADDPSLRCGLGSLMTHKQAMDDGTAFDTAMEKLNRPYVWLIGFAYGFDGAITRTTRMLDEALEKGMHCDGESLLFSQGFRAGWSCGNRVISIAPVEIVPEFQTCVI